MGHSYGGVVISEAGNHAKVAGLVYVAAFAPDAGESVSSLIQNPPPGAPRIAPIHSTRKDGFLFLDKAKFARSPSRPTSIRPSPSSGHTRRCRGVWPRSRAR